MFVYVLVLGLYKASVRFGTSLNADACFLGVLKP